MIKERYVSFEIAKLLKEKGMDKNCFTHYMQQNNNDGTSEAVTTCTHQMAMDWLRKKGIEIEIRVDFDCMSEPPTYAFVGYSARIYTIEKAINVDEIHIDRYETYEEAVEAAILYSLENLI